jgi:DNA-binding GntR family transcriptional regulator
LDALEELVEALELLLNQPDEFFACDQAFHVAVVRLSQNVLLLEHYEAALLRLKNLRLQFPVAHVALPRALRNQRDLYAALRTRDPAKIAAAVDHHLSDFEEILLGEPLSLPFSIQTAGEPRAPHKR